MNAENTADSTPGKTCRRCLEVKPLDDFPATNSGQHHNCRQCYNAYARNHYHTSEYRKAATRDGHLKAKYGVSLAEYGTILHAQGGVCAICRQPETVTYRGKVRQLAVDHDHATGKVRGLLCKRCNTAIGCFFDDWHLVQAAAAYMTKHDDTLPPKISADLFKTFTANQAPVVIDRPKNITLTR